MYAIFRKWRARGAVLFHCSGTSHTHTCTLWCASHKAPLILLLFLLPQVGTGAFKPVACFSFYFISLQLLQCSSNSRVSVTDVLTLFPSFHLPWQSCFCACSMKIGVPLTAKLFVYGHLLFRYLFLLFGKPHLLFCTSWKQRPLQRYWRATWAFNDFFLFYLKFYYKGKALLSLSGKNAATFTPLNNNKTLAAFSVSAAAAAVAGKLIWLPLLKLK